MPLVVPSLVRSIGLADLSAKAAGTTITASGTPHALGSWASVLDPVSFDAHALALKFRNVSTASTATEMLADLGIGPSGGGSEQIVIPDLDVGAAQTGTNEGSPGKTWVFPLFIKAGLRLSCRVRALIASDTVIVNAYLLEHPLLLADAPGRWYAYGADQAASRGTSVTEGSGSFGSWTQIGASNVTVLPHTLWSGGYDHLGDTTITGGAKRIEFGYGPDSGSVTTIGAIEWYGIDGNEGLHGPFPSVPICCPVPAASTLWARIDGTSTEARGVILYAA